MKIVTVRDLRNSFARVSRWLEVGETVEVTKRGRVFARILPVAAAKSRRTPKPDILARLQADFGTFVVTDEVYNEVRHGAGASHVSCSKSGCGKAST